MRASIVTVGDELLAGDVENTNATWLAARLTERGVDVPEIRVVPDEVDRIATAVAEHGDRFDAAIVTGGLGSTPDDVTVEGIAAALGVSVERDERTYRRVAAAVAAIRADSPDFDFDVERAALRPAGSDPIENDAGIAPGFVCENVYAIPGIPSEMRATFEQVAAAFSGDSYSGAVYSTEAESHLNDLLRETRDSFDVTVGCYPDADGERKRITVRSADPSEVDAAVEWLVSRPEVDGRE